MKTIPLSRLTHLLVTSNPLVYQKFGRFNIRPAIEGEVVLTEIDGKTETSNKAKKGDYIVTGVKGERYIIDEQTFHKRYKITSDGNYQALGQVYATPWEREPAEFVASWGEKMIIEPGDFLCATVPEQGNPVGDPYRIEKEVFFQTYKPLH